MLNDILNPTQALTMSSSEIAEVLNKRHDKVKQSIERLVERGVIVQPPMGDEQDVDKMGRTRTISVYYLEKRDSYIVVAQLSPEATARLVDRWQELEQIVAKQESPHFEIPKTLGDALQLAADQARHIEALKPKAESYDAFMNCEGVTGLRDGMRSIGAKTQKGIDHLKSIGVLFYEGKALTPKSYYMDKGYFVVRQKTVDGEMRKQAFFTPKGLNWAQKTLPEGLFQEALFNA